LNPTLIVQFAPAATLLPQLFALIVKSPGFVPLSVTELMVNGAVPPFVNVTAWLTLAVLTVWTANERLVGASVAVGTPANPVPLNPAVCGEPVALSAIVKLALLVPVAVGLNVTVKLQAAPTATLLPQAFVTLKSPAFVPLIVTEEIVKAISPLFVSVTVWPALVVPTFWLPNERLEGERKTSACRAFSIATT
jgi:hypothetical protein